MRQFINRFRFRVAIYDRNGGLLHDHFTWSHKRSAMMLESALYEILDDFTEADKVQISIGPTIILALGSRELVAPWN